MIGHETIYSLLIGSLSKGPTASPQQLISQDSRFHKV